MLSLAYRIATMPSQWYGDTTESLVDSEVVDIIAAQKVRIDNVVSWYDSIFVESGQKPSISNIPNGMPPFANLWIEANFSMEGRWAQVGCLIKTLGFESSKSLLAGRLVGNTEAVVGSKWVAYYSSWSSDGYEAKGKPIRHDVGTIVFLDKSGKVLAFFSRGGSGGRESRQISTDWAFISSMAMSFMHCKNVRQIEAKDDRGEQFHKQHKVPRFRYRTLVIDPMKEVLRTEGGLEANGLKKALHICRGHFATYSNDKPLFGKYNGTFWKPDHVRGNKESGVVRKDYDVKAGQSIRVE